MEDLNSIHTPSPAAAAIFPGFPVLPFSCHTTENMFVSGSLDSPPSPSPQASILSIHSLIGDGSASYSFHSPRPPPPSSSHHPFDRQTSSSLQELMNPSSDRRHKRVIKNRESAARSRARKQESLYQ
uniref:BZIP domain-containing protein n=1 Tax=Kalanchoe fedtschenkoi TaxID=63787 RepID=A0A7N0V4L2_KALFE